MSQTFYYPERMGRIILLAMEEVLGRGALNAALTQASLDSYIDHYPAARPDKTLSFETVTRLMESLEAIYGPRGGRGFALRVGRACFKYGLREYSSLLGITEMGFRLLPLSTKLRVGAKSFADLFNKHTDQRVQVEAKDGKIYWQIERCPLCWERRVDEPVCHLATGLLQESLYWLSGGKIFSVEETDCRARGDACCMIVIDETPLS
jgi:predicted hydrocarbon binding protein